jgi:hypothetical protein
VERRIAHHNFVVDKEPSLLYITNPGLISISAVRGLKAENCIQRARYPILRVKVDLTSSIAGVADRLHLETATKHLQKIS